MIPSRWAFEALMVEQFCDNAYNQTYFPIEKEKYLAQYYGNVHLPEVRTLAQQLTATDDPQKRKTVENELVVLARAARIEPRPESENYLSYLDKAEEALHQRAHNFTAYLDQVQQEQAKEKGGEWMIEQKKAHHNMAIEDLVMGAGSRRLFKETNNRIYPIVGTVYVEPDNRWGRAAFYSHEKNWAGFYISTYKFNLLVIGFFALLAIIAIFAEFPGRFLKRDEL